MTQLGLPWLPASALCPVPALNEMSSRSGEAQGCRQPGPSAAELPRGEAFSGAATPPFQHGHPQLCCQKTSEPKNHKLVGFVD